jgi:hypothetical protein
MTALLALPIIAPDVDDDFKPTGKRLFIRPRAVAVAEQFSAVERDFIVTTTDGDQHFARLTDADIKVLVDDLDFELMSLVGGGSLLVRAWAVDSVEEANGHLHVTTIGGELHAILDDDGAPFWRRVAA